jgi:nucleoside-diphosphate-sugar epimerase
MATYGGLLAAIDMCKRNRVKPVVLLSTPAYVFFYQEDGKYKYIVIRLKHKLPLRRRKMRKEKAP